MTPEQQLELLLTRVKSMVIVLNERLGDDNPWNLINYEEYSLSDLAAVKRLMHELLYPPPPRK